MKNQAEPRPEGEREYLLQIYIKWYTRARNPLERITNDIDFERKIIQKPNSTETRREYYEQTRGKKIPRAILIDVPKNGREIELMDPKNPLVGNFNLAGFYVGYDPIEDAYFIKKRDFSQTALPIEIERDRESIEVKDIEKLVDKDALWFGGYGPVNFLQEK